MKKRDLELFNVWFEGQGEWWKARPKDFLPSFDQMVSNGVPADVAIGIIDSIVAVIRNEYGD